MDEKTPSLDTRVEALTGRLGEVERRLSDLERRAAVRRSSADAGDPDGPEVDLGNLRLSDWAPLVGRTLLALAGAFVLRMITEQGIVPTGVGVALGIGYAVVLIVVADRAAARGREASAAFHALAGVIVAFPLLWEATAKFEVFAAPAAATVLAAITALGLGLAWRREQRRAAWVFALPASITALAIAVSSKSLAPSGVVLLLIGFGTLWAGYTRGWRPLAWTVAVVLDAYILLATVITVLAPEDKVDRLLEPQTLVFLQLGLIALYLGSAVTRALIEKVGLTTGGMVQSAVTVVLGLGGAIVVTRDAGLPVTWLGIVSLALAGGSYAAAFAFIDRRTGARVDFAYFTSLALVFTLVGFGLLPAGLSRDASFALAAVVAGWLGDRKNRATLSLHGAVYATAAAVSSGLLQDSVLALVGSGPVPRESPGISQLMALAAAGACAWFRVPDRGRTWGSFATVSKLVALAVFVIGSGGLLVGLVSGAIGDLAGPDASAETWMAPVRTGVLAVGIFLLAWLCRWPRFRVAFWLVYPLLGLGFLKLVVVDLRTGRTGVAIVSLLVYGGLLLVAPRMARRAQRHGAGR